MKKLLRFGGLVVGCFCAWALIHAATIQVDVSPGNLEGWAGQDTGSSTLNFVNGPASPPCGTGSAEFRIDSSGASQAALANPNYNGTRLNDLTALSYSTFVITNNGGQPGNGGQAVFIALNIDLDGNGSVDDTLYFE